MQRKIIPTVCVILLGLVLAVSVRSQDDKLTYDLTMAKVDPGNPQAIEVLFGKSVPDDAAAGDVDNWLIIAINTQGKTTTHKPVSATADRINKLVLLEIGADLLAGGTLDPQTNKIIIRYQQMDFPDVVLGVPKKTGVRATFGAAKGKDDADIYFKGTVITEKNRKPLYSIESKFSYLFDLQKKGAIGGKISADFAQESNLDADSIIATGTYEKILRFGPPSTGVRVVADFIGGEFDRKNKTRNLVAGVYGVLIIPGKRFSKNNSVTANFLAGFEAGHNYRNSLVEDGIGNFWRPKFGVNTYFLFRDPGPLNRITASAEYKIRLPRSAEPFTRFINDEETTFLTKKPRHDYLFSLDFMFTEAFGISVQHRYGSVPPVFKLIDNKVSLGLVFKLKQKNN